MFMSSSCVDVTAILFIVACSSYNLYLREDPTKVSRVVTEEIFEEGNFQSDLSSKILSRAKTNTKFVFKW